MFKVRLLARSETFGGSGTVSLFSDLLMILPMFFPFVYPFDDIERTPVPCCIDGSDASGNVCVGVGDVTLSEQKLMN